MRPSSPNSFSLDLKYSLTSSKTPPASSRLWHPMQLNATSVTASLSLSEGGSDFFASAARIAFVWAALRLNRGAVPGTSERHPLRRVRGFERADGLRRGRVSGLVASGAVQPLEVFLPKRDEFLLRLKGFALRVGLAEQVTGDGFGLRGRELHVRHPARRSHACGLKQKVTQ